MARSGAGRGVPRRRLAVLVACLVGTLFGPAVRASEPTQAKQERLSSVVVYDDLFSVELLNPGHIVAVGGWGRIARSDDGGQTWQVLSVAAPRALLDVTFVDDEHGWIVGEQGLVLSTRDGGESWLAQSAPTSFHLFAVTAVDRAHAWVVGERGTVLRTIDGGRTWIDASLGEDLILNDVFFQNVSTGWIVGEFGTVLRSGDGGVTWESRDAIRGAPPDVYLYAVRFTGGEGLAVGLGGTLLRSTDAGRTWNGVPTSTVNHLFALELTQTGAVAVGDQAVIRRFEAAGALPPRSRPEASLWLRDVAFRGVEGYAVGAKAQVLRSEDGGHTWADVSLRHSLPGQPLPEEVPE